MFFTYANSVSWQDFQWLVLQMDKMQNPNVMPLPQLWNSICFIFYIIYAHVCVLCTSRLRSGLRLPTKPSMALHNDIQQITNVVITICFSLYVYTFFMHFMIMKWFTYYTSYGLYFIWMKSLMLQFSHGHNWWLPFFYNLCSVYKRISLSFCTCHCPSAFEIRGILTIY